MKTLRATIALLALAVAISACAAGLGDPTEGAPSVEPIESIAAEVPSLPSGEVPTDLLQSIVAAAAERAGVEPAEIQVVAAEAVTWNDGSIGCPEPGMMYTQALVPGYRVVLEADGRQLNFHATESGDFRFCENPRPPLERSPNE